MVSDQVTLSVARSHSHTPSPVADSARERRSCARRSSSAALSTAALGCRETLALPVRINALPANLRNDNATIHKFVATCWTPGAVKVTETSPFSLPDRLYRPRPGAAP